MRALLATRIPIAWFLLALILFAAGGIVWLMAGRGSAPANALLISSVPTGQTRASGLASDASTQPASDTATPEATPPFMVVYVSGEVFAPGVYTLPTGSRVADAIAASGGFTDQGDRDGINLAARLHDEQHIAVPRLGASPAARNGSTDTQTTPAMAGGSSLTAPPPSAGAKININSATAKELETLPGIGEVLAGRIVADRQANGPFKKADDLMRVPGIKEGLMSQLRDLVTVGP
jgi:competence protein ComEA